MEIQKNFLVTDFGVKNDSSSVQTKEFQTCIETCRLNGGGKIIVPKGEFIIGSIRLYSNMTLYLEEGAYLKGSKNLTDYQDFHVPSTIQYLQDDYYKEKWNLPNYYFYGMIVAYQEENIEIIGEKNSVIDGSDVFDPDGEEKFRGPMGIILSQVKNIELKGYTFINSSNWSHTIDGGDQINIDRVKIKAGHDGFNLHHSQNITINQCDLQTGDDCLAGYDITNLMVTNCYLNTACNSMRIGGVNLKFDNCFFEGPGKYPHISEGTFHTHAFFKYYSNEADTIQKDADEIVINNCKIQSIDYLLKYKNNDRDLLQNNVPLRKLSFTNTSIIGISKRSFFIGNGENGHLLFSNVSIDTKIEDIFLEVDEDIKLTFDKVNVLQPVRILAGSLELTLSGMVNGYIEKNNYIKS